VNNKDEMLFAVLAIMERSRCTKNYYIQKLTSRWSFHSISIFFISDNISEISKLTFFKWNIIFFVSIRKYI